MEAHVEGPGIGPIHVVAVSFPVINIIIGIIVESEFEAVVEGIQTGVESKSAGEIEIEAERSSAILLRYSIEHAKRG